MRKLKSRSLQIISALVSSHMGTMEQWVAWQAMTVEKWEFLGLHFQTLVLVYECLWMFLKIEILSILNQAFRSLNNWLEASISLKLYLN